MSFSTLYFFFSLQVLIAFVVIHGQAPNCRKEKQKCKMEATQLSTHDLFSVTTEEELRTTCNIMQQFIACKTNYLQACGDSEVQLKKTKPLSIRSLMNSICTPEDPFIPKFLEFTACQRKVAPDYNLCLVNFEQEQKKSAELSSTSVTSKDQKLCCNFEYLFRCTRSVIQKECGKVVADIGEEFVKKMMTEEFQSTCSVDKFDSSQCSFVHNDMVPSASSPDHPNECQLSQRCQAAILYWRTHAFFKAITEDQLRNICESAENSKACAEEHIEKCGATPTTSDTLKRFYLLLGLINAVCKPGDQFRQRYMVFTNAYPKFAADLAVCREQYLENKEITKQLEIPEYKRRAKLCCDYETLRHCRRTAVESKFGKAVADIAKEVYGLLGYNAVESSCSVFGNNNPECPSSYSSSVNNANPSAVTALKTATSATSQQPLRRHLNML